MPTAVRVCAGCLIGKRIFCTQHIDHSSTPAYGWSPFIYLSYILLKQIFNRSPLIGNATIGCKLFFNHARCIIFSNTLQSYDMPAIEGSLGSQKIAGPTELTFLTKHLRELPEEARKYLVWAAFFGET